MSKSKVASWKAAKLKAAKLEREIWKSSATATQKANMQHTLSKLTMFASEALDPSVKKVAREERKRWEGSN